MPGRLLHLFPGGSPHPCGGQFMTAWLLMAGCVLPFMSGCAVIPYAAMEAPLFFWDVPDYLNYAGVGHMIAHELMHGFDGTGQPLNTNTFLN